MSKSKSNKEQQITYRIRGIEIIEVKLSLPTGVDIENVLYIYNINIQHRINHENKLIFVDTSIEILHHDKETKLGFLKTACAFEVDNLLDFKSENDDSIFDLPEVFVDILNSISISSTRGIMFSQFRGTFLHNAILPIIDPKKIKVEKKDELKK